MGNSMFKKFNKNNRIFNIDNLKLRKVENDHGELVNEYLRPEDLFEADGHVSLGHVVKAIYRNDFTADTRRLYPDLPGYRYNLIIKMGEDDYVYLSAPLSMNAQFDEIMADQLCIREIQKDNCVICAYHFTKDGEDRYGIEFC